MKRYKPVFNKVKEDEDNKSEKAIKDLIDLNWGEDEDHQNTAPQLIKGLIYANTPTADKFIQDLSDYTSSLKIEDFKEGCKKKPKKKGMKEATISFSTKDDAKLALSQIVAYLTKAYGIKNVSLQRAISWGIFQGTIDAVVNGGVQREDVQKYVNYSMKKIIAGIKERI